LRRTAPPPVALPPPREGEAVGSVEAFVRRLQAAGGEAIRCSDASGLGDALRAVPSCGAARRIVSTIAGVPGAERAADVRDDPHALADVDVAIARARFGVAESGAVWVSDSEVPHRALYFLAQHLVLVLPSGEIVGDLHAAYQRIARSDEPLGARPWQGFIAGPSKTADIEQALVVGAHGPRSLCVVLVG
jgi:L-lactate dehydrogenase complex protein LldG